MILTTLAVMTVTWGWGSVGMVLTVIAASFGGGVALGKFIYQPQKPKQ